jgi:flagellar hook-associated protein 3 FlgL
MRVTQSMLSTNMLRNISNSYERLGTSQDQLATGKKITKPSDDPVVAIMGMEYRENLEEVNQFNRNLDQVYVWMDNSDDALDKATQVLQRVRELTVQASNGTLEESQRSMIAKEINELNEHLVAIANTEVGGKYLFNGTATTTKPVQINDGPPKTFSVSPTEPNVYVEVSKGINIQVNSTPGKVFSNDLFSEIQNLVNDLETGNGQGIDNYLGEMQAHLDNLVSERAELGARYNRVEMIEQRLGSQEVIASRVLSENEDIDYEKVIMDLKTQESVHRAALAAGSRIIQPTLLDFLR